MRSTLAVVAITRCLALAVASALGVAPPWPASPVAAQTDPAGPAARVDACVQGAMRAGNVPGAVVAVRANGDLVFERSYGVKHREQGGAVDAATQFRIGSTTKHLTAAAVMRLVDAGRIALDDPVVRHVPEFRLAPGEPAGAITLRHLLTHTSGLPDNTALTEADLYGSTDPAALRRWVTGQGHVHLHAPPGTLYNYSNANFAVLGHVIERVTSLTFDDAMAREVFQPAGMADTAITAGDILRGGNWAFGHWPDFFHGGTKIFAPDGNDNTARHPAGYVWSTAADLTRWASVLLADGGGVLTPASAAAMQGPQASMGLRPDQFYGFGTFAEQRAGQAVRHHGGVAWGWSATLAWVPAAGVAAATVSNTPDLLAGVMWCAIDAYAPGPGAPSPPCRQDRARWAAWAGRYGGWDHVGAWHDIDVTFTDGELTMDRTGPDGKTVRTALRQTCGDVASTGEATFVGDTQWTFLADPVDGGVTWLRSRFLVGRRPAGGATGGGDDGGDGGRVWLPVGWR